MSIDISNSFASKPCFQKEKESNDHCKGCICNQLRHLQTQTKVDLYLLGGQIIKDVYFITIDSTHCCAFFNEPKKYPEPKKYANSTIIVDCKFIQSIRIAAA